MQFALTLYNSDILRGSKIGLINVSRGILFAGDCSIHDVVKAAENYNDKINGFFK